MTAKPERWMDSEMIDAQHSRIIESVNTLLQVADSDSPSLMASKFRDFSALVTAHFSDEEELLARQGSDMLATQQKEHGVLSRMLASMLGLMETSELTGWRSAVIGEAIDALAVHFAKEEACFSPLLGRQRATVVCGPSDPGIA
ncbi:MAG: hypothetical protein VR70_04170 [Rhodospirillaceae bacterium BRH_c57]|nr:MAG: hypothetical protein VR70_04170 [Rhodospirillaceae bacterium BRH_c57]